MTTPTGAKPVRSRLILFAGIAVIVVGGAVAALLYTRSATVTQASVVVATHPLAAGSQVNTADVQVVQRDASTLPSDVVIDPSGAVGKYVLVPVGQNAYLEQGVLGSGAASVAAAGSARDLGLRDGDVALALPVGDKNGASPELAGVDGLITPNSHIDVLIDDGQGSVRYAFQDLRVITVGSDAGTPPPAAESAGGAAGASPAPAPVVSGVIVVEAPRAQASLLAMLTARHVKADGSEVLTGLPRVVAYVLRPADQYGAGKPNYLNSDNPELPTFKDFPANPQTFATLFRH